MLFKKLIHEVFLLLFMFFILMNNYLYAHKDKADEPTAFKSFYTIPLIRHLYQSMGLDTKIKDGKYIHYYNLDLLDPDDKRILSNLNKLESLAEVYDLYIDLNKNGVEVNENDYANLKAYDNVLNGGLIVLQEYLDGLNKEEKSTSCFNFNRSRGYSFNIKKTQLCQGLIDYKMRTEAQIHDIGKYNKAEHADLLGDFCHLVSTKFVERVKFKKLASELVNIVDKGEDELLPDDKRSKIRIEKIRERAARKKAQDLNDDGAGTSQGTQDPKKAKSAQEVELVRLLSKGNKSTK